jgi:hypothetical protein
VPSGKILKNISKFAPKSPQVKRMSGSTVGTNQHYVPQSLLRGFLFDAGKEQLFAFDKQTGRSFKSSIRNIAAERDFYTLEGSDVLDNAMNQADDLVAPILQQLRERPRLTRLTQLQRAILAGFTAIQMIRTRGTLERWRDVGIKLAEKIAGMRGERTREWEEAVDPNRQREMFLDAIPRQTRSLMHHLLMKSILLFQSDGAIPFWISDNPVVRSNIMNPGDGVRGTLGVAVKGIEIYLPVSSTLTLGFMCPTIAEQHEYLYKRVQGLGFLHLKAHEYLRGLKTGLPIIFNAENVRFQNSLQVHDAERFIFAQEDAFQDASEMVTADESLRFGRRFEVR